MFVTLFTATEYNMRFSSVIIFVFPRIGVQTTLIWVTGSVAVNGTGNIITGRTEPPA